MTKKYVTGNRLRTIYKRQKSPPWNENYQAGIFATREEAPEISRASILTPEMLGRYFHCLSEPEKYLAIFGFFSQKFSGAQEQRMMPAHPTLHPLATMPGLEGIRLPNLPGILAVAEKIGATEILRIGSIPPNRAGDKSERIILPFFSDILWAIREEGPAKKCLNWNIKDVQSAFAEPFIQRKGKDVQREVDIGQTATRHTLERLYYQEADIRTVQLSLEQLDETLRENLRFLFGHHRRKVNLDNRFIEEFHERLITALDLEIPPFEVVVDLRRKYQFSLPDVRTCLWQLIWRRELRVDLFSTLLIDRPFKPETIDPVVKYSDWFRG